MSSGPEREVSSAGGVGNLHWQGRCDCVFRSWKGIAFSGRGGEFTVTGQVCGCPQVKYMSDGSRCLVFPWFGGNFIQVGRVFSAFTCVSVCFLVRCQGE